jgi:hypothetical protein
LVPLAFVSPRIVSALLDGTAPANLTVTTLALQGGGPVRRADHEGVDSDDHRRRLRARSARGWSDFVRVRNWPTSTVIVS